MSVSPAARICNPNHFFILWLDHMHVVKRPVMAHFCETCTYKAFLGIIISYIFLVLYENVCMRKRF